MPGRELSHDAFEAGSHSLATGHIAPLPFPLAAQAPCGWIPVDDPGPRLPPLLPSDHLHYDLVARNFHLRYKAE
jgi:hypothetical protein